jgi:hypothetical protein
MSECEKRVVKLLLEKPWLVNDVFFSCWSDECKKLAESDECKGRFSEAVRNLYAKLVRRALLLAFSEYLSPEELAKYLAEELSAAVPLLVKPVLEAVIKSFVEELRKEPGKVANLLLKLLTK